MSDDLIVRSVTISEIIDPDGERFLTTSTEGEPAPWDVLGMLDYARMLVHADQFTAADEDDEA